MKNLSLVLLLALTLPSVSCTDAQWRRFQEINSTLANYVNDAMLAVNLVKGFVEAMVPATDRGTVSDVFDGIQACNEALQAEASVVQQSGTLLDTPAHVASAFPHFISAWNSLSTALHLHNLGATASGAPMARPSRMHTPRIVRVSTGAL